MAEPAAARQAARRRPTALRRRLVVVLVGVLLLFTVVLATTSTLALRGQLVDELDHELVETSQRVSEPPGGDHTPGVDDPAEPTDPAEPGDRPDGTDDPSRFPFGIGPGTVVVRYDGDDVAIAGFANQAGGFTSLDDEQLAALGDVPVDGLPHDVELPGLGGYRAVAATTRDGSLIVVAQSTADVDATVQQYVLVEVAIGLVGLVAAGAIGTWLVRRSLRPLDEVATAAGRVSELDLAQGEIGAIPRVPDDLTDERTEVGQVGAALNRMLENVESSLVARHESETQVRRFVADASHELRTPLASIRGYAELVRRSPDVVPPDTARSLDRIESEAVRMTGLVEDLLLLARLDAGRPLDRAPVDLAVLAVDAVTDAHAAGPDHDWGLLLPGEEDTDVDLEVTGDEASLRQVLANLLANARTHTPPGTRVDVRVRDESDEVVVEVSDAGPGIGPALRPVLFRRFARGDDARNRTGGSTGLGLAIVDAIVAAHGGRIDVTSATADEPGPTGTTFTVRLPRHGS
ncbi:sensor histidine kinase [Cellulosimicrobium arenosum]|uniref:histidine kinase n=1 Tax=Cellulosimicrobium arenosum TaxID=2708133 RepID=A0A927IYG4_9MICO|nr:HAMP domain-containing sensor histidine kinase [Cellulosimicrobium arenosum]MBD8077635.1 HAMP domain-containing histidine kinase [Cellulosimicrobium arenosum]